MVLACVKLACEKFTYDLLEVDKPQFGGIVFPRKVVDEAIVDANRPGMFDGHGILELCRFDDICGSVPPEGYVQDEMISRLSDSGRLLEVIGYVRKLEIVGDVLRCHGDFQGNLYWIYPFEGYTAVPYVEMRLVHRENLKIANRLRFTEIVMVYQAVTKLALRKFAENKNRFQVLT